MDYAARTRRSLDWWRIVSMSAMTALYVTFAYANFVAWRNTGRPVGLGLTIQEGLVAVLFVTGRRPMATSRSPIAWLATAIGAFGMLAARPTGDPVAGLGALYMAIQFTGVGLSVISLGWLGRSFGLVAANRGIQTRGPYGLVRHPAYAAYMISYAGYLLENPSLYNVAIFVVVTAFQLVRIGTEEQLLSQDPTYVAYKQRVRYRLLPGVY